MRLTRPAGVGLGLAMIWFSMLALLPLIAVVVETADAGWTHFVTTVTEPQTYAALTLTVVTALIITIINTVMGTMIAWVLVRDRFPGRRVLEVVIDIPFALPTIVAGLVLLSLYGPQSPLGINIANTRIAVGLAFLFVTLPFVVRTVQPVLADMDRDVEQAAASLGATPAVTWRRIVLPTLFPAMAAGAAMSFARALSEYGALVLLSGNLPMRTEAGSVRILSYLENGDQASAAAIATMLLAVSFTVIVFLDVVQRKAARRG
ncbi:sulfate ABC transporter, inner membrane subunit CysT [Jonesia denitrificans DSM 20603]|uniref:Sulfate transport system permease protein CysT n=2 Tax=Jonesia TaxID=43673 RepID=C7R2J8_JONDD|nr:sulfate ABC transporter permease subunit CysT [Jonesia denitrificans]ACV09989.1 sulfate ABC transporter, inner membrane subunit CysT [Jonesia denitrificans DSM 20603]SQH22764.1 Sulfate transport system permease protein CysW [Jonesia denitrificans]